MPKPTTSNHTTNWHGLTIEHMVFFRKSDVRVGTLFHNHGRKAGGSLWRVEAVARATRRQVQAKPGTVAYLSDHVTLRDLRSGELRKIRFGSLSYSAIWWLERWAEPKPAKPKA